MRPSFEQDSFLVGGFFSAFRCDRRFERELVKRLMSATLWLPVIQYLFGINIFLIYYIGLYRKTVIQPNRRTKHITEKKLMANAHII